ncbi:hypothetical protein [Flavobacterium anhuiense]|uniref:hypothetical protein n=1 Tax=Flavobacterium anhuiense TaxID=459526 RepID=UPI0034D9630F
MSTNHNRIRVADLEKNQPNKILKTNQNGELEFSDANNLQVESYNALDCIVEGKTLDARQGKVLKDMIDNKTVNLASDAETQINIAVSEDSKVVSRSKLFNWWQWVKSQTLTITGVWNFSKGLKTETSRDGYTWTSQMTNYSFFVCENTPYHYSEIEISANGIRKKQDNMQSFIGFGTITQDNLVNIPNQSGTLALKNDFVKTAVGTTETPSLIIPNGKLTTVPQNGAIERDAQGDLYHVVNGVRYKISDNRDSNLSLAATWKSTNTSTAFISGEYTNSTAVAISPVPSGALGSSNQGNYLFKTFDNYLIKNGNYSSSLIAPKSVLFEVYLKGNNCKFSGNQYIKLYSVERTDVTTENSIRNYEIPMQTNLSQSGDFLGSVLMFSETTYDTFGNKILENYKKYFLQTINYVGNYTDLKFSDASISLEYRVSVLFDDSTNQNSKNVYARPSFTNYSSLFLKI